MRATTRWFVYPYGRGGAGDYSLKVTATRTLTYVATPTGMSATICDEDEKGNVVEGSCIEIQIDEKMVVTAPRPTVPPQAPATGRTAAATAAAATATTAAAAAADTASSSTRGGR